MPRDPVTQGGIRWRSTRISNGAAAFATAPPLTS